MAQINLHTTPEFEEDLARLMRKRGIKSKSEAIRSAVREAAEKTEQKPIQRDWSVVGWANRLPGQRLTYKSAKELLDEIDQEMDEKLDRLSRGIWTKPK